MKQKRILVLLLFTAMALLTRAQDVDPKVNDQRLFDITKNTELYAELLSNLNNYSLYDVDPNELSKTALDAMMASIDPYTRYYTEGDLQDFLYRRTGKYEGIGFSYFKSHDSSIIISEIAMGGAAENSNMAIGDTVVSINGQDLKTMNAEEVRKFIQSINKDDVQIVLAKAYNKGRKTISLDKGVVEKNRLGYSGWYDQSTKNTAIIKLNRFSERCGSHIEIALDSLFTINPDMQNIILDLRSNPGGLLHEAVNIVNLFVDRNKLVVYTQGRYAEDKKEYTTSSRSKFEKQNLVVLVDSHSASASEIVSGALQDYDRAVILGQNTFGKGLVQNTRKLGFNEQMKLTTAKYYIPSGRCIQALDYARKDKSGEPHLMEEWERQTFYTANKRPVKDGRGVSPDVEIAVPNSDLLNEIVSQHVIFGFVSQALDLEDFRDVVWSEKSMDKLVGKFVQWALESGEVYQTSSLRKWKNMMDENTLLSTSELADIRSKMDAALRRQLDKEKDRVGIEIKQEIEGRLYNLETNYDRNKKEDSYINKAMEVLNDKNRYAKILSI